MGGGILANSGGAGDCDGIGDGDNVHAGGSGTRRVVEGEEGDGAVDGRSRKCNG